MKRRKERILENRPPKVFDVEAIKSLAKHDPEFFFAKPCFSTDLG